LDGIEQDLTDFEPAKLPRDIKREAREEWHYMLWLRGYKQHEIEDITGYERTTIYRDIKRVMDRLGATPRDMESIRQMALMSLRLTRAEVMSTIRKAEDLPVGKVPYGHIARLYDVAAGIDEKILERYTQTGGAQSTTSASDLEKSNIILDFIISKFGPEALDGFQDYYTRQLALKKAKSVKSESKTT